MINNTHLFYLRTSYIVVSKYLPTYLRIYTPPPPLLAIRSRETSLLHRYCYQRFRRRHITVATTVAIITATTSSIIITLLYFLQIKNILGNEVKQT